MNYLISKHPASHADTNDIQQKIITNGGLGVSMRVLGSQELRARAAVEATLC